MIQGLVPGFLTGFLKGRELLLAAVALFLLLALAYSFSAGIRASRSASITGDEPFYLLTTQSLIADGDLDLTNQYAARSYKSFFDHPNELWRQSVFTPDGRLLSPHNPGLSLLVIPGFALGGLLGAQVQLLLLAAAALALAFVLADRLTGRRALSWAVALGVGLSATAFIYSTEVYPEFPAALALVVALLLVTGRRRPGLWEGLGLAASLTALCWLGTKYVPLALPVSGYFLLRSGWSGRAALVAAGSVSAGLFIWFHLHVFGGLTPYGVNVVYARWSTVDILGGHVEFGERYYRLWGLFIDRRFGIGRWAPLLLAAVPGLALLAWGAATHRLLLGLILLQLLIAAFVAITMMGWWFPGRTLLTVLPLLVVPIVLVFARAPVWGRAAVALLGVYTAVITAGLARARTRRRGHHRRGPLRHGLPALSGGRGLLPPLHLVDRRDLAVDHSVAGAGGRGRNSGRGAPGCRGGAPVCACPSVKPLPAAAPGPRPAGPSAPSR